MIKLEIIAKNNYEYILKNEIGQEYTLNLEFLDIDKEIKRGDCIFINNQLLNPKYEGYSTSYTFGDLDNKYGKQNISKADIDVIKIVTDKLEIYLKRLYG